METVKSDTTYIDRLQKDSIYLKDSIYIHSKNDTVFVNKYRYKYVDRYLRDTTYISKVDSVQVPYPVEKPLSKWQQFKMDIGGFAIGAIVILVLALVALFFFRRK